MKVKYKSYGYNHVHEATDSVEGFTADSLLYKEGKYGDKVYLENQPAVVARALGRLLNVLLEKNLITAPEFMEILDLSYSMRDAELVKELNF